MILGNRTEMCQSKPRYLAETCSSTLCKWSIITAAPLLSEFTRSYFILAKKLYSFYTNTFHLCVLYNGVLSLLYWSQKVILRRRHVVTHSMFNDKRYIWYYTIIYTGPSIPFKKHVNGQFYIKLCFVSLT